MLFRSRGASGADSCDSWSDTPRITDWGSAKSRCFVCRRLCNDAEKFPHFEIIFSRRPRSSTLDSLRHSPAHASRHRIVASAADAAADAFAREAITRARVRRTTRRREHVDERDERFAQETRTHRVHRHGKVHRERHVSRSRRRRHGRGCGACRLERRSNVSREKRRDRRRETDG